MKAVNLPYKSEFGGNAFMPKIIWYGNKSWDTNFPENTLPNNAKLIERPDNVF